MEDKRNSQATFPEPGDWTEFPGEDSALIALPKIVLASASPRRAEILRTVGWPFEILPQDIDETRLPDEDAVTYVRRLALGKAEAAARQCTGALVVGADTTVVIGDKVLEKPHDHGDARRMLRQLSGRWHQVVTGVAVIDSSESRVAHATTEVKFAVMMPSEIDWYVASGQPMDKAGAYAIQGPGSRFIEGIRGEYFNVVGLPVRLLYEMMREHGARTSLSA
jgi:septum formation protein